MVHGLLGYLPERVKAIRAHGIRSTPHAQLLMNSILVLGSTGSIGTQTLDCVRTSTRPAQVVGLAAQSSWKPLLEQCQEFSPSFVALTDEAAATELKPHLSKETHLFSGPEAVCELVRAAEFDVCVHGIVGAAGLEPSVAVLKRGKTLALANKESLVVAGAELMALAREHGASIVPVDSEHCAIFQCLQGEDIGRVRRIILTASGGPFRETPAEELASVTPEQALRHPNWTMGPRITIGSATLMNKALEIIEVHHLYGVERARIDVVVHPQSIVHSMVEFVDGSVLAQMSPPDMRGPIHYCLNYPERVAAPLVGFDLERFKRLDFEAPDTTRFPALELGYRCVEEGSDSGCFLNAADEISVEGFLAGRIGFTDIARVNEAVLQKRPGQATTIEQLLCADELARDLARSAISALESPLPK